MPQIHLQVLLCPCQDCGFTRMTEPGQEAQTEKARAVNNIQHKGEVSAREATKSRRSQWTSVQAQVSEHRRSEHGREQKSQPEESGSTWEHRERGMDEDCVTEA